MTAAARISKIGERSVGLVRFASQIRSFLAEELTPDEAQGVIRDGVVQREERFLGKMRRAVYGAPRNPYRRLLEHAGCEWGDVEKLVRREGLESALADFAAAGVRLSFDELKRRTPVVRGSLRFSIEPEDLDDPAMHADSEGTTGGSSGRPARVRWSFAQTAQSAPHWCVFFAANGCLGAPLLYWRPGHAGASGAHVAWAKFGRRMESWFVSQEMTDPWDRAYAEALRWIGRRFAGFPPPRLVPYDDARPVLDEVLRLLGGAPAVCLNTTPSAAARLSRAARERGDRLDGLVCMLGAEPLTPARRVEIEASGARATPLYGSQEATWVGGQCPHPEHPDEVHVLRDLHAVVAQPGAADGEPPPLLFTSLAPITPKVLWNADIGDRGVLGSRRCDCLYDELGCRTTLHTIRSSDKITGFGVTFAAADVSDVLETVLPQRFGGASGDYQLVESDGEDALPRYLLLADPRVGDVEPERFVDAFLSALGRAKPYYGFMAAIWRRERAVRALLHAPLPTPQGKIPLFRRMARAELAASGAEDR